MTTPFLLLGTHYHPGSEQTLARQARARASLEALRGVKLVNLQFPDAVIEIPGFETVPQLLNDSNKITGREGVRKPVGNEAFDRLAACAEAAGLPYFAWVNSDITVLQSAIDLVEQRKPDAVIYSRMDFDAESGEDRGMFCGGLDMFVISTAWWQRNRFRYRPYVNSEAFWDPIYATIAMCHGGSLIENRQGLIRHEMHDRVWRESPFGPHNRHLATLDTLYLNIWTRYRDELLARRAAGATLEEELAWQKEAFRWPPPLLARAWHVGRCVKAWLRRRRASR